MSFFLTLIHFFALLCRPSPLPNEKEKTGKQRKDACTQAEKINTTEEKSTQTESFLSPFAYHRCLLIKIIKETGLIHLNSILNKNRIDFHASISHRQCLKNYLSTTASIITQHIEKIFRYRGHDKEMDIIFHETFTSIIEEAINHTHHYIDHLVKQNSEFHQELVNA